MANAVGVDVGIDAPTLRSDGADRGNRAAVFALTWLAYATYYLGRKGFPVAKVQIGERFGLSMTTLGDIDTAYLAAYSGAMFVWGAVGDRIGARRLLGLGMLGAAAACVAFGAGGAALAFGLAFMLNGFFQASGWPGTVKAMGSWFGKLRRGTAMGLWSTCYQVGGLAATAVAGFMLLHFGWRWAFFGPAAGIAAVGLVLLAWLPERGDDRHRAPIDSSTAAATGSPTDPAAGSSVGGSTWAILRSPAVLRLGAAYFCLKLIRYSLLFWLPYYLEKALGHPKALVPYLSMSFEAGGVLGSVIIGALSDRLFPGRRRLVSAAMIVALAGALLLYLQLAPLGIAAGVAGMALVGLCLFGPDTLVSGAAAQDLGGTHAVARVAGAVNGLGSLGAILQGRVTSGVTAAWGWRGLFMVFVGLALLSAAVLAIPGRRPLERSGRR